MNINPSDIIVYKSLRLIRRGGFSARVSLGFSPVGAKTREGDGRTPEGEYVISTKSESAKYLYSLGISYPNPTDARRALVSGVITVSDYEKIVSNPSRPPWDTPMGGFIMIHGTAGERRGDWTAGCVALSDEDMRALYAVCEIGDRVIIVP